MPSKKPRRFRGIDGRLDAVKSPRRTDAVEELQFMATIVTTEEADLLADLAALLVRTAYPEADEDVRPVRRLLDRMTRDLEVARRIFDAIKARVDLGELARAATDRT